MSGAVGVKGINQDQEVKESDPTLNSDMLNNAVIEYEIISTKKISSIFELAEEDNFDQFANLLKSPNFDVDKLLRGFEHEQPINSRGAIQEAWIRKFFDYIQGFKRLDEHVQGEALIPIAELHCPHIKGCKSEYIFSSENKKDGNLEIKIMGGSFGGGIEQVVKLKTSIPALNNCRTIYKRVPYQICKFVNVKTGEEKFNVEVLDGLSGMVVKDSIDESSKHFCSSNLTKYKENLDEYKNRYGTNLVSIDWGLKGKAKAAVGGSIEMRTGKMLKASARFSVPVEIFKETINFKLSVETSSLQSIEMTYYLEPGYSYLGFYSSRNSACISWIWD
jgi:hypothetical protein